MTTKPSIIVDRQNSHDAVLPSVCRVWCVRVYAYGVYSNDIRTAILKPSTLDMGPFKQKVADPAFLLTSHDASGIAIGEIMRKLFIFKKTHRK